MFCFGSYFTSLKKAIALRPPSKKVASNQDQAFELGVKSI